MIHDALSLVFSDLPLLFGQGFMAWQSTDDDTRQTPRRMITDVLTSLLNMVQSNGFMTRERIFLATEEGGSW